MKALRKIRPERGLELVDIDRPVRTSADDVLVRVIASGICGSDLHVDDWTSSYTFMAPCLPVTLGHDVTPDQDAQYNRWHAVEHCAGTIDRVRHSVGTAI